MLFILFICGGFYYVYLRYGFDYVQLYAHLPMLALSPLPNFSCLSSEGTMGTTAVEVSIFHKIYR